MIKCRRISLSWIAPLVAVSVGLVLSGCEQEPRRSATNSQKLVATSPATGAATGSTVAGPKPELKPGAKTVVLEAAGDRPFDKTFDNLRFEMTVGDEFKREMLPPTIEAMKGQRIRIRGYILPTAQARGLKAFVLVRDNQQCCLGPGAALYDCVLVEMQPGKTAEYTILPVTVDGTFDIQEFRGPDGKHLAIYHLEAESVE
jgi:hypothetical protein